ncbi:MAG TPA: Gfo/Idh/MocA family oxidoreductase, partial [Planctomycetota bacterium]|nr:Gfo/Idh/MocA family oxidoreductase [Planctomycetota bacterium]
AEVVAVCDPDSNVVGDAIGAVEKKTGRKPEYVQDLRKIMDDKSIDIVSIAMPNHWHVLASIWAIQSGKDVYVEKPLGHNLWEQRRLVDASRKYQKIVQMGNYTRSLESFRSAIAYLRAGKLGRLKVAHGICYNKRGSIRKLPDGPVPAGVDYNLWQGPAAERPFNPNRFHYNWHWNFEYGGGEIANNGIYYLDIARWGLGKTEHPKRAMSVGGRLGYEDDGTTPNSQISVLDYGDVQIIQEVRGLPTDKYLDVQMGNVFHCEEGYLSTGISGVAAYTPKGELLQKFSGGGEHFRNFADAVKARNRELLNSEVLEGHLSTALCHLPNISHRLGETRIAGDAPFEGFDAPNEAWGRMAAHLKENGIDLGKVPVRVGKVIPFDGKTETVPGDDAANRLLSREYRKPFAVPENV